MDKKFVPFNVNENVRVKLKNYGKEILFNKFLKCRDRLPNAFKEFVLPKEDSEGWSEWQMWSLMEAFGEYMHNGSPLPFNGNIEIEIAQEE